LQTAFVIAVFEFVLLVFSLSVHECAHAWMASRLGDQTARLQGRVTLNPIYHVDPFGTLLFPALALFLFHGGLLFGWAKPTPVITRNFKKIVRDDNLVTLAGPVSNLLLILVAFVVLAILIVAIPGGRELIISTFQGQQATALGSAVGAVVLLAILAIQLNLTLFFFNLLPVPPLDGSRIVRNLLPYNAMQVYDRLSGFAGMAVMIILGWFLLPLVMGPSMGLIFGTLLSLPGPHGAPMQPIQ
jgi:Zn-dependent protease